MKVHIGSGGSSPYILNHGAREWYVVSFTLRPKYACGTTAPSGQQAAKFSHDAPMPPFPIRLYVVTQSFASKRSRVQVSAGQETVYRELHQA
jgi:hypothetical protein